MLSQLRKSIKPFSEILAKPFVFLNIYPNIVSSLAIPLALISANFILQHNFPYAILFAILASLMDLIDGAVARQLKKVSNFGNYYETMVDKVVEIILYSSFALFYPIATAFAIGFSMLASYAKPRAALVIITDNRDWPAIGEHAERLLLFMAGLLLSAFNLKLQFLGMEIMELSLWAIAAVSLVGAIQRIFYAKKLIAEAEKKGKLLPYLKKGKER